MSNSTLRTSRPLQGKRILVTRTREQASALSAQLTSLGAEPVEFPTIRIVPPTDWTQLDAVLTSLFTPALPAYDWLVLTSANGVNICCERLLSLGYDLSALRNQSGLRIATIGPATAAALAHYGLEAALVPDEYIAEGVIRALLTDAAQHHTSLAGQRILLARAAEARKILVTELQQAGALVDEVAAYYTVAVDRDDERSQAILQQLQQHQLDILTFTSSSTVRNFVAWLKSCEVPTDPDPLVPLVSQQTHIASIGPITSQTARELGLTVSIEAQEFTIDGLVRAIVQNIEELS